jgi:RES domain
MSSDIWTQDALQSSITKLKGKCWRVVEAQHRISTMKITDTLAEQAVLEDLLEETKPLIPKECRHLDFLLLTPFRYSAKNSYGSRFRRPNAENGVFYAAEQPSTAMAETAFHRILFYAESPATPWPTNASEYTAFSCAFKSDRVTDIARKPYLNNAGLYHLCDYSTSQAFADAARSFGFEIVKYKSMRDPKGLANLAILHCTVFTKPEPLDRMSWRLHLDAHGARALCESPRLSIEYDRTAFASDPRLANFKWER